MPLLKTKREKKFLRGKQTVKRTYTCGVLDASFVYVWEFYLNEK